MPSYAITIGQMRAWERETWAQGQSESAVIARVGEQVALLALGLTRDADLILVLAGKGNNGKDALAACAHLRNRRVESVIVSDPAADFSLVQQKLKSSPTLVIDALFGIGINRGLSPEWIRLIEGINDSGCRVLAVDVPSGMNGDTGEPQGACVRAHVTLTVGAPKVGQLKTAAAQYVGRLVVAPEVGLSSTPPESDIAWSLPSDFKNFPAARPVASHKGTYGHAGIIAGSKGYHGAAVLCARGAQRAQPGLVTLVTSESAYVPVASQLQAVMVGTWSSDSLVNEKWTSLVIGPGLAGAEVDDAFKRQVREVWQDYAKPLVVDASALGWLPKGKQRVAGLRVITPHPGEAARMLGRTSAAVQADRFGAVRALALAYGNCWVVLKGHQTLIGTSAGKVHVNSTGNPYLAQGGSGDVLAGFVGGLLAQQELANVPHRTLSYAVYQHGRAADVLQQSRGSWTIEELVEGIGKKS